VQSDITSAALGVYGKPALESSSIPKGSRWEPIA
jgi:hypothetical protein